MGMIQTVKDSFYRALRDRIAAGNPARTMVVRGLLRPAVFTVENELPVDALQAIPPAEAYCLRWTTLASEGDPSNPLVTLGCEILYASEGSAGATGMDRGRALAAMDTELLRALLTMPMSAPAISVQETPGGGASEAAPAGCNVYWSAPRMQPAALKSERLQRTVDLEVFCYGY